MFSLNTDWIQGDTGGRNKHKNFETRILKFATKHGTSKLVFPPVNSIIFYIFQLKVTKNHILKIFVLS